MNWTTLFAERTHQMKRSAVRELLRLTARPGMISFAGGLPASELFPLEQIRAATDDVITQIGAAGLQYGETEGIPELRDWIAAQFSKSPLKVRRSNVAIVTGAQQALDLIGRILLNSGDKVLIENPTYLALLSAWRPQGISFLPVKSDENGLCIAELEQLLQHRPKLIYTIPNFQNPQGTTLALERRTQLTETARAHGFAIVEDNPYGDLWLSGSPLPHLLELDAAQTSNDPNKGHVIYVGTFSKVLVPGLRVGWVIAPEPIIEKLVQAKQATDLHTSTLNQHIVHQLVGNGFLKQHIPRLRQAYRERRDAMLAALEKFFPYEVTWTRPEGGMFLMVTMPKEFKATEILPKALEQNVAFVPGDEFHADGRGENTFRLNYSKASPELICEGIRRLGALLKNLGPANSVSKRSESPLRSRPL